MFCFAIFPQKEIIIFCMFEKLCSLVYHNLLGNGATCESSHEFIIQVHPCQTLPALWVLGLLSPQLLASVYDN